MDIRLELEVMDPLVLWRPDLSRQLLTEGVFGHSVIDRSANEHEMCVGKIS